MQIRSLLLIFILSAFSYSLTAQKVKKVSRKGETPVTIKKESPTSTFSIEQFSGKWQEVSRRDRNTNRSVAFNDTLFYNFSGENVFSRDGVNMSLRGKASVE